MRKLATVREVNEIKPITNSDFLELVIIDGWQVVVKKDLHKLGEKVIYFEIDSFLPEIEQFEFLRANCYRKCKNRGGFKIKTIKLRGEISQGLVMPLKDFNINYDIEIGTDLTEKLNVILYENDDLICSGDSIAKRPSFIKNTSQDRYQNIIKKLVKSSYFATEKLEGCSASYYLDDNDVFHIYSKNEEKNPNERHFWSIVEEKYEIENKLRAFKLNGLVVQGEIIGTKIQGNYYDLNNLDFYVFNLYDVKYQKDLKIDGICDLINLKSVPLIGRFSYNDVSDKDFILSLADGVSQINKNKLREGLVFKSTDSDFSFKVISNKYLLKQNG